MTTSLDSSTILTGKRKRAAVSYVEDKLDILVDLDDPDDDAAAPEDFEDVDDFTFGSRRKSSRKLVNKRLRWTAKPKPKAEKVFRFLELPPELRDIVYEMALTDTNGCSIVSMLKGQRRTVRRGAVYDSGQYNYTWGRRRRHLNSGSQETAPQQTSLVPSLLAVNKQIYSEGANYLYGQDFYFEDTTALHHFLATIGLRNQPRLIDLTIKAWGAGRGTAKAMNFSAFSLLVAATNLKSIFLDCAVGWYSEPEKVAGTIYRNAHYFLEAYGVANGDKGAAVDIIDLGSATLSRRGYYGRNSSTTDDSNEDKDLETRFRNKLRSLLNA